MEAIKAEGVGKRYIVFHEKEAMVRHLLLKFLRIRSYEKFWALKGINFSLEQGRTLGIIGRNGVGKSTLLSLLAGISMPTEGQISLKGRVSTLLSLGAGFHPELTGEENIYLNGSLLGLRTSEIRERFNRIVEFSELGDFIDAPLQTYSSGMYLRLGFAIAIHVDFDILLIDEILSVGDIAFQNKCLEKLDEFRKAGKTLVIVSQSLDMIENFSHKIILLDKGKIEFEGEPQEAISRYREIAGGLKQEKIKKTLPIDDNVVVKNVIKREPDEKPGPVVTGWATKDGTKEAEIVSVRIQNSKGEEKMLFKTGDRLKVEVDFVVHRRIDDPHFGVAIFREDGLYCYGPNTRFDKLKINRLREGKGCFSIEYKELNLLPGKYRISVAIWEKEEKFAYDNHYGCYEFEVISDKKDHGAVYLEHRWRWRLP